MTTLSAIPRATKPERTIVVQPSAFADDWSEKPLAAVACGLRTIPLGDIVTSRAQAAEKAWKAHPQPDDVEGRVECFNDALAKHVIARATCSVNDISQPWEVIAIAPDDMVFEALTGDGARFLFDAIEAHFIATSPVQVEATDEDVCVLVSVIADGALPPAVESRVRKLIRAALEEAGAIET